MRNGNSSVETFRIMSYIICDALGDVVPFVQFQKRAKHSCRRVTLSKGAASSGRIWDCSWTDLEGEGQIFFKREWGIEEEGLFEKWG